MAAIAAAVATSPELATAAVVIEWRLNVPADEARDVAILIEPGLRVRSDEKAPLRPAADRVEAALLLEWDELTRLAKRAGVRPRPGQRLPGFPQPRDLSA